MNLYSFHDKPTTLHKHVNRNDHVPKLIKSIAKSGKSLNATQLRSVTKDATLAYWYAKNIIGGPWPPGEKAIATDKLLSLQYAMYVVKGEWPPGEKIISLDPAIACSYAVQVVGGKWPPGEKSIATDAGQSYSYARDAIKGKWPPGEGVIATDPIAKEYYNISLTNRGYPDNELI